MLQTAQAFLDKAKSLMVERGRTYDKAETERSMPRTIRAFNAITGRDLTESEGWLLMLLLKQARQWSAPSYHQDSAEDGVAYAALLGESLSREAATRQRRGLGHPDHYDLLAPNTAQETT